MSQITQPDTTSIAARYLAVWSEADPGARRAAIAALWAADADDEVAWAARVFLLLGADGRIDGDYQLTVKPLAA